MGKKMIEKYRGFLKSNPKTVHVKKCGSSIGIQFRQRLPPLESSLPVKLTISNSVRYQKVKIRQKIMRTPILQSQSEEGISMKMKTYTRI